METQNVTKFTDDRLKNLINNLSKCKLEYINWNEESKKLRDVNMKLENELRETIDLEKSHRNHLLSSREMISNLQDTITQLLYVKRDVKKLNDIIKIKDATISSVEMDKVKSLKQLNENMEKLRKQQENEIDDITSAHSKIVQQLQFESETKIAQCNCLVEELRGKLSEMETSHNEKVNLVVLEYEEKIQRSAAQVAHLQGQLERQTSRMDANVEVYRRKLEELEEKLKQSQFKEYLAHTSYPSQYENRVEKPYIESEDYIGASTERIGADDRCSRSPNNSQMSTNKTQKSKPIQVIYKDNKCLNVPKTNDKKGPFNISKRRKLYNEKDYLN